MRAARKAQNTPRGQQYLRNFLVLKLKRKNTGLVSQQFDDLILLKINVHLKEKFNNGFILIFGKFSDYTKVMVAVITVVSRVGGLTDLFDVSLLKKFSSSCFV